MKYDVTFEALSNRRKAILSTIVGAGPRGIAKSEILRLHFAGRSERTYRSTVYAINKQIGDKSVKIWSQHKTVRLREVRPYKPDTYGALVDAAPGMLKLLKFILSGIEHNKLPDQTIIRRNEEDIETQSLSKKIRAMIDKATGVQ